MRSMQSRAENKLRKFHSAIEGRAFLEAAAFHVSKPLLLSQHRGDGHGVFVIPGFMAPDALTSSLRKSLCQAGYRAVGWDNGPNIGMKKHLFDSALDRIRRLRDETGEPVSLIGWSMGGTYAKALANTEPELVRQAVSLGGAININPDDFHPDGEKGLIRRMFDTLNPPCAEMMNLVDIANQTPAVPFTSIYSRTDGIVHNNMSIDTSGEQHCQNIGIGGSHIGLTHNPLVLYLLLRLLPMHAGNWKPLKIESIDKLLQLQQHPVPA